jgi:NO-binding membrane sensor protein with MHYT domain
VPTHIDNLSHGWIVPALAYTMSCLGALLGLLATARARSVTGPSRAGWLVLAAFAIGGTGIWVMHFIAMLGFDVPAADVRYGLGYTLVSILIAVVIVGAGLFTIGFARRTPAILLISGVVTGLGVAAMHYTGMAAVHVNGHIEYDAARVLGSIVIAVVACTAALWAALYVRGSLATVGAALVMGLAVSGMHYTGMSAVTMLLGPQDGAPPSGLEAWTFLVPMIIGVSAVTVVILFILVLSPSEHELLDESRRRYDRPGTPVPQHAGVDGGATGGSAGRPGGGRFGARSPGNGYETNGYETNGPGGNAYSGSDDNGVGSNGRRGDNGSGSNRRGGNGRGGNGPGGSGSGGNGFGGSGLGGSGVRGGGRGGRGRGDGEAGGAQPGAGYAGNGRSGDGHPGGGQAGNGYPGDGGSGNGGSGGAGSGGGFPGGGFSGGRFAGNGYPSGGYRPRTSPPSRFGGNGAGPDEPDSPPERSYFDPS